MSDFREAMDKAAEAAQKLLPGAEKPDPESDSRLIQLRQLFKMSWRTVRAASSASFQATTAYLEAQKTHKEISAALELREMQLGILTDDTDHDLECFREETDEHGCIKRGLGAAV